MKTAQPYSREQGFTLLEVLVALAVFAVGAAIVISLISGVLGNIRKVQVKARTIQHAETVMQLALLDDSIQGPTSFGGDFEDGTRWTVRVEGYDLPAPPQQTASPQIELPVKLFSYTVEVLGPDSRVSDFRLETLKIVNTRIPLGPPQLPTAVR